MKWILGIASLAFLTLNPYPSHEFSSRYTRVESYEIRPGMLATPKYAGDGALCEISIEKRHVQGNTVDLGSAIPRKLSLEMIDELAPPSQRGKATIQVAGFDYIDMISGSSAVSVADYQNVSVEIHRTTSDPGDIAIILTWKNTCGSSQTDRIP